MAEEKKPTRSRAQRGADIAKQNKTTGGGGFEASPEAKSTALKLRIVAMVLWLAAIGLEIFTIVWALLPDKPVNTWLIIGLIVAIGVLTLGGSLLWKKANRYDPASEKDKTRFFIQNQLGVIMTVLAFLPLIVLIFLDKNMDGKQKGILGAVAIAVAIIVGVFSYDKDAPSKEQYSAEINIVEQLTDKNEVWYSSKGGTVFHVCKEAALVTGQIKPENLVSGTVQDAHAAGIDQLTTRWVGEALNRCDVPPERVNAILDGDVKDLPADVVKGTVDDPELVKEHPEETVESFEAPAGSTVAPAAPATTTPRATTRTPATSTR
ncbi:hypothetical protein [Gordonia sp. (in: high G+C Gram-positive bacteria)]|uniref:hypothetical protein n=1 Tax=Gordonia sp. (in: high G+C Gram-positive bacteria) TaxID=84139 RepID=UPI003528F3A1